MSDLRSFHFKWSNTLLMIVVVTVSLVLSHWQYKRVEEKKLLMTDYHEMLVAEPIKLNTLSASEFDQLNQQPWQRVSAEGEFLDEFAFFLDSQVHRGRPGYHYLVPLALAGSEQSILVNLGWLAAGTNRQEIPEFPAINLNQPVIGQLSSPRTVTPGFVEQNNDSKVQLFINISKLSEDIKRPLAPMVLLLDEQAQGGLPRAWPAFDAKIGMHQFYVIHWLFVAIASILLYIYFGYRAPKTYA